MKQQGNIVELKFMAIAIGKGIAISLPFGDNQKYDCITDRKGLNRVQIKSTSRIEKSSRLNAYNILVAHGAKSKEKYTKNNCDVLALYVIPEDAWYFVPVEQVTGKTVKLYPHIKNAVYKYEKWREAWELI